MSAAKRWVFTLNNYNEEEYRCICDANETFDYLVVGKETGESGTPHLQGYVILSTKLRLRAVKALRGFGRCHLEVSRGTPKEASDYCKKEADYEEFGTLPASQGKRTDFESLKEWIKAANPCPSHTEIADTYPSLWGRYRSACIDFAERFGKKPDLVNGNLRPWQQELDQMITGEADDRKVVFVIDRQGNKGKSWLTKYWFSKRDDVQRLSIGKREDLAFALDVSKRVYVFDIPRGGMEFLQYSILEGIKDRMVFSAKYESTCKLFVHQPHVIVFCNEGPDVTRLSDDRYEIKDISDNEIY